MRTPRTIGVIPAAGQASRLAPLPMSKELYPLGFEPWPATGKLRPKTATHYLLDRMRLAGVTEAFFVLRDGKWDIPAYFGDGGAVGMNLGYVIMGRPYGVPFSVAQVYPFARDARIVLGFPDILFEPEDAYQALLAKLDTSKADVVLGVVPFDQPQHGGMVAFDQSGRVRRIIEKPGISDLKYGWFTAVWKPSFTDFLHEYLAQWTEEKPPEKEIPFGDVIQAAIATDLWVDAAVFPQGAYIDVGVPQNLIQVCQTLIAQPPAVGP